MCSAEVCRTAEKTCAERCFDGKVSLLTLQMSPYFFFFFFNFFKSNHFSFASRHHKDLQLTTLADELGRKKNGKINNIL